MGLQPHLILRVLHRILIFYHRNFFSKIAPPDLANFLRHCSGEGYASMLKWFCDNLAKYVAVGTLKIINVQQSVITVYS